MIGLTEENDALPPPPPRSRAPELVPTLFAQDGVLATALGLEHRPQQEAMARGVTAAQSTDASLLFEAGTGVGKSLAYLLPGIIQAVDESRQMIVSTHTIALQEQLDKNDLPLCRRVFSADETFEPYANFKSAVLVGKANYLCTTRLAVALRDKQELIPTAEHTELQRIATWAGTTEHGIRHELQPPPSYDVWDLVNADSSSCSRKYCNHESCFYQKARARLRAAHVIILNHSLFFAHIAAGAGENGSARGVLFPDDFVVLDEAHTVPAVATEHCGLHLSSYGTDRMLKHLFNPRTRRGLMVKHGGATERQLVEDALEASTQFFAFVSEKLLSQQNIVRVREEGFADSWLDGPLLALHKAVRQRADKLDDGRERDELLDQAQRIATYQTGLRQFLSVAEPEKFVYWVERTGRRQSIVTLRTAPIDIAPFLKEELFGCDTSVVCTSATLALAGRMKPFQVRMGATEIGAAIERSPFDFARNFRAFVATDMPLPTRDEARLARDRLVDYIRYCALRVSGGTLVLFTSYADLRHVAAELESDFLAAGRPLLCQGGDLSRTALADRMRECGNAVLFGTDSFWTGIDVPGPALSQVIITRLPFEVPTHPVLEARTELIRDRGGNPFNELTLPDALVKFRQGVGRLIRQATDQGVVTLLDARIVHKPYGRWFIDCLPEKELVRMDRTNRDTRFLPFA
ncbi:ATP-dependent DNA helicase [Synoicihabitans lomoniglobus]|uniref:Helicase C-terminal domain-containing protein n=1 Tax=Synoicihabitans lomoniglobus TaxID=2909285 RepID=A0AAF0CRN5_9BACT|nr:ATP-dependent DNA helicase [Opitutaceae bacterium LMO-M01]WED66769.1 helicase C-terminal domain-containing protein [Opitutaceae bacterium LMO-M01]